MSEASRPLSVFISYARSDASAFAEELLAGLEAAGFDPFLDRHDIAPGEDWQSRLGALLQRADTVVYVLSPSFVGSERCQWEINHAKSLSKRILPVVAIDVAEADTPEDLRRLNYIFFSQGHPFGPALRELATALRSDIAWIREHTRLAELAARWRERNRAEPSLLRGSELEAARTWLAGWKSPAPEPTDLHRDFINESEAAERARSSEERKRLEAEQQTLAQLRSAQEERERALARVARANVIWACVVGALLLATAAGGIFVFNLKGQSDRAAITAAEASARALAAEANASQARAELVRALDAVANVQAQAGAATQAPSAAASTLQAAARQARSELGWDFDIFYCEGANARQNQARAQAVNDLLANAGDGLPYQVGRLRVRPLRADINARQSYRVTDDSVRAEASEMGAAEAMSNFLAGRRGPALIVRRTAPARPSPYYLSAFLCEGTAL